MPLEGGCLCGRVRYALRAAPGNAEHCHCGMCRKWHGAAFATYAELPASALEWKSGESELTGYRSSPSRERMFCRHCGAKLFIRRLDEPDAVALMLATLDGDPGVRPARHVMTAFAVPWYESHDSLPRFTVYPGWETELRPTAESDLDFVLAAERAPENAPFIGQWTREQHAAAIAAADREHWLILRRHDGAPLGFLIAFDLRSAGHGIYVKRIVVHEKSRGLGREALGRFAQRAFRELGASHMWLAVFSDNERAQRSYRALGFSVQAVPPARRAALHDAVGGFSETSLVMRLEPDGLRT